MAVRIAEAAVVFSGITSPLKRDADKARATVLGVAKAVDKIGARGGPDPLAATLRGHSRLFDRAGKSASRYAETSKSSLASVAAFAAGGVLSGGTLLAGKAGLDGLASIGGVLGESVQIAANFEQTSIAFETMLGSAGKASAMLASIKDFAASSPLTFEGAATGVKQLIAYGISADQALPTIRALTDIASGTGVELSRLTMAYGQVATAGQLYGTELRQFTEAGVPLIKALASSMGVAESSVKGLVEEGKVGFPQVVRAMKFLTEDGGQFAGMTEKYGKRFAGVAEQLTDAVQTVKRELGTALVEELGLKDAARDLTDFTGRTRSFIDEMRPGIRLVGDGAKAIAQLVNEGGKAARIFAEVRFANLVSDIPALKELPALLTGIFKDIQDFRINRVKVTEAAITIVDAMMPQFEFLQQQFGRVLGNGKGFRTELETAAKNVKAIIDDVLHALKQFKGFKNALTDPSGSAADLRKQMTGGPFEGMDARLKRIREAGPVELRVTPHDPASKVPGGLDATKPEVAEALAAEAAAGKRKRTEDALRGTIFFAGGNPFGPPPAAATPPAAEVKVEEVAPTWAETKPWLLGNAQAADDAADAERALAATLRDTGATLGGFSASAAAAGVALAAVGAKAKKLPLDAGDAAAEAREKARLKEEARIKALGEHLAAAAGPRLDPVGAMFKQMADIGTAAKMGLVTPDAQSLGVHDAFKSAAKGFDLNPGYRPPSAAEYSTADFARMEAAAFAPSAGPAGVKDILEAIKRLAEQEVEEARRSNRELEAMKRDMGVTVTIPGG